MLKIGAATFEDMRLFRLTDVAISKLFPINVNSSNQFYINLLSAEE